MPKAVITGCNRGIGLELAKQLKAKGFEVIGICRKSTPELENLCSRVFDQIDVSRNDCGPRISAALNGTNIDLLINNAGIYENTTLDFQDEDAILRQFQVNSLGPLRVTQALLANLMPGSKVALITSRMGSIADNASGGSYGYRMSKAALNIAGVSLAHDLKEKGIAVGLIHPGYVKTAMTDYMGHIEVRESAAGIINRIEELSLETTGSFRHANGESLPW